MTTNKNYYVPVLKWKKGEQIALQKLSKSQKDSIIPLIELTDVIEPNLFLDILSECYNGKCYIDTTIAYDDDEKFLSSILEIATNRNMNLIPVIYSNDLDSSVLTQNYSSIAIKIGLPEDIEGPSLQSTFKSIKDLKNNNINLDLILDLGLILTNSNAANQFRDLKNIINEFLIDDIFYNSLIICSTSFPENLSNLEAGSKSSFKRFDYLIYKKIIETFPSIKKYMYYSDYGVTKFTDIDIDFSLMKYGILPKMKYTCENEYILWKGKRNKTTKHLDISYYTLAEDLLNSKLYYGPDFSYGDLDIKQRYEKAKANNTNKCGNGTTWVTVSANHHIAVVIEQLSKLI